MFDKAKKKQTKVIRWRPPEHGIYKLNVDASFDSDQCEGGTGMGFRDHDGKLLRAQAL